MSEEKICPIMSRTTAVLSLKDFEEREYLSDDGLVICQREKCMAWYVPKDLNGIQERSPDSYNALIKLIAMQENCYERDAETILNLRNEGHCKLIERGGV